MSFLQVLLLLAELVLIGITAFYFLKFKNQSNNLEIMEIKASASKKKSEKESTALSELKKRLDEQKVALDKQWHQLQADQKSLEERALAIENDRKLLDRQRTDFSKEKIELEQQQLKFDKLTHNLESKWEQQQAEFELEKEKFRSKIKQFNISVANFEAEKEKLKLERQKIEQSERFLTEKFNELKRLKAEFELQREQFLNQQTTLKKVSEGFRSEAEQLKKKTAEPLKLNKETEAEKPKIQPKATEEKPTRTVQPEAKPIQKIETKKPPAPAKIDREVPEPTPKLVATKETAKAKSPVVTSAVKKIDEPKQIIADGKERLPKLVPDIVCWKIDEVWNIGLKFSGKMINPALIRVIQNNVRLKNHETKEEYWNIKSFASLFVQWQENNEISFKQIEFYKKGSDVPLIFKLDDEDLSCGRFVSYPTMGNYLVIVPEDWERVDNKSADQAQTPQMTSLEKYVGHLCVFDRDKNKSLAFKKKDGTIIITDAKPARFVLKGNQVSYSSDDGTPLFGDELPTIVDQRGSWDDMGTIVVAEQREDGFEWLLTPQPGKTGQDLNQFNDLEIAKSSCSNFKVNLYDKYDHLVECTTFRYVEGLKRVTVFEPPAFPGADGHQPGYIKFYHNQHCTIELVKNLGNWHDIIVHNDEITVATIPPDPAYDQTEWDIRDQAGRKIRIRVDMQRVWWGLANEASELERIAASDKLLQLSTAMLTDGSYAGIRAWLPKACWGKPIHIGFSNTNRKAYLCNGFDQSIFIPMQQLKNYHHLDNQQTPPILKLWLTNNDEEWVSIAELLFPLLSCKANGCDFNTNNKAEMIEHIKASHFSRFFKSLSYEEIRSKYNRNLPVAIYQCDYCGTYILADHDAANPTATIIEHIEKCPEVDRESRLVVRFKQVTDIAEIREKAMTDIPEVTECSFCGRLFENQQADGLVDHLLRSHESEIIVSEAREGRKS